MSAQKPANWDRMSYEDQAQWLYLNAGEDFVSGGPANYNWQGDLKYNELGGAPKLGQTNLSGVTTDPKLLDAQMRALAALEEQSNSGLSAGDELALNQTSRKQASDARARQMTMEQNLAAKGRAGGRLGVTMQMQASQNSDQMAADDAARRNAMAQDGRLRAKMGAGEMAGSMSAEEYRRKANQASAQDQIDQFNTNNSIRRQEYNSTQANSAQRDNWSGKQNIANQNTNADYGFRKDSMGVQQDGAQYRANKASEDWNRAELRKQKNAGRGGKMFSGAAQGAGAGAAFGPWGALAGGVIGAAANYAHGGKVPGDPLFPNMDTEYNDTFSAQLSPGEIVLPRSVADDPIKSAKFVAQQNAMNNNSDPMAAKYVAQNADRVAIESKKLPFYPTPNGAPVPSSQLKVNSPQPRPMLFDSPKKSKEAPIPEPVLKQLESTRPDLVAAYRKKMSEADQGIKDAEGFQDTMGALNFLGKAANDYSNNQKQDVVLKNRMQDWGKAPEVVRAQMTEYDGSVLDKLATQKLNRANKNKDDIRQNFNEEQSLKGIEATERMKDPNSPESVSARAFLISMLPTAAKNPAVASMSAAQLEKASPALMEKWKADQDANYKNSMLGLEKEKVGLARVKANTGRVEPKLNQSQAASYGKRLLQAEKELKGIESTGYNRGDLSSGVGSVLPNIVRTDSAVRQDQAERNFLSAVLRRESGASISDSEMSNGEAQYFDRVGDGVETKAQKARNRAQVLEAMRAESGPAWAQVGEVEAGVKEVKRQTKDGKTAIFNADTKEFIRYE